MITTFISACASSPSVATPSTAPTETATEAPTETELPTATATTPPLEVEVVQSHLWVNEDGTTQVIAMLRNPYDFPINPSVYAAAELYNQGDKVGHSTLGFWGLSFLPPGGMVGVSTCFDQCEFGLSFTPLPQWDTYEIGLYTRDATGDVNYTTDLEGSMSVSASGAKSFSATGSVTNNSDTALVEISARVFLFDQTGNLVGVGQVNAFDVPAGATVPWAAWGGVRDPNAHGPFDVEVSLLGIVEYE